MSPWIVAAVDWLQIGVGAEMANSEPEAIRRLKKAIKSLGSERAKKIGREVQLHKTDVVLTGPRKNGNTWTQHVTVPNWISSCWML